MIKAPIFRRFFFTEIDRKELVKKKRYFSISADLLQGGKPCAIDLYVNSSTVQGRDKFVKVHHRFKELSQIEINTYVLKYHQLYVLEAQRKLYLREIFQREDLKDSKKAEVMKNVAIDHLKLIFNSQDEKEGENLFENDVMSCRDSVVEMIEFIEGKSLRQMQQILGEVYTHDSYTYDHSVNVAFYSVIFLKFSRPNSSKEELLTIGLSGLLHDLGKRKISTTILNNPGQLTDEQFTQIKKHPEYGEQLMGACSCEGISPKMQRAITKVILEHHENVNGTGYPSGLNGDEISLYSKMVAITDFFDAITSYRSYHEPLSYESALVLMTNSVGKKIDGNLFDDFKKCVGGIIIKGNTFLELPEDFDPCRPQNVLPFRKREPKYIKKDINQNRKVKKAA